MGEILSDHEVLLKSMTSVLDKTDAYIFFADAPTKQVIYVNKKLEKDMGIVDYASLGCEELLSLIHNRPCESCSIESLQSTESPAIIKYIYDDEKKKSYKCAESLLDIGDGITVIMHHITVIPVCVTAQSDELAETKKKLAEALEIIEAGDKGKTDFLSRMSHELCTPMNAIISMAHIAVAAEDTESMKSCVSVIYNASAQLLDIINDILDMSRIELGQVSLLHLPFDLSKMIAETIVRADASGRIVHFDVEKDVPSVLRGDEYRLSQVLLNLIKNLIMYTAGRGKIEIRVRALDQAEKNAVFEFRVIDIENKVPKEKHAQIIRSFEHSEDGEYIHYGEAGLGTTICKRIIEMMGGNIWAENTDGAGISFYFTIQAGVAACDRKAPVCAAIAVEKMKVLFVDSDEDSGVYYQKLVNDYKIQADYAKDGGSAARMVAEDGKNEINYSVVFIDYKLQGIDGIAAAKRIREINGGVSIVIMIPMQEWTTAKMAVAEAGLKDYLPKPVLAQQILDIIGKKSTIPEKRNSAKAKSKRASSDNETGQEYKKYLPYIDVDEGLSNISGNKKLFGTMLRSFRDGNAFTDLEKAIKEENISKIQRSYGILKNASVNLALKKLYKGLLLSESQLLKTKRIKNNTLLSLENAVNDTNQKINELLAEWE